MRGPVLVCASDVSSGVTSGIQLRDSGVATVEREALPAPHCSGENAVIQLVRNKGFGRHLQGLTHPFDQALTTVAEQLRRVV